MRWFRTQKDDLRTLERRIDDIESAFRRLQMEWTDTFEKMRRLAGRITKREEREAEPEELPVNGRRLPTIAQLRAAGRDPFQR